MANALAQIITRATAMALVLLLAGCATPLRGPQHPLENVIVDAGSGAVLERSRLLSAMAGATVVYLGEKHDNPAHHEQQLWILSELIRLGHRPVLGLEIFATAESGALMEYASARKGTGTGTGTGKRDKNGHDRAEARLREATGMNSVDDERWMNYGPLLQLAREHKLTVFGIDLPMPLRRRVSRIGIDALSPVERSALPDIGSADPKYRLLMLERLKAAHCGHGEEPYLQRLFENWQARNATMASAIATAASERGDSPVLVVLGGGHVRDGEAVIPRVAAHMPDARQLIVSFVEVNAEHVEPLAYVSGEHDGAANDAAADTQAKKGSEQELLWFTAAHGLSMEAACKMFRSSKKKTSTSDPAKAG